MSVFFSAMRVIAGTYRSRTLQAPPGLDTRPTSDRLREALFNVLAPRMEGAVFLDLYAGSGAVGIEALSRGAVRVVFVERATAAMKALRANLERLGIASGFTIESGSVAAYLRRAQRGEIQFDLVFLDPPWDAAAEYEHTLGLLGGLPRSQNRETSSGSEQAQAHPDSGILVASDSLVIAEHRRKVRLEDRYGTLVRTRLLEQGDASLSFYVAAQSGSSA